jgi:hypothetical protein
MRLASKFGHTHSIRLDRPLTNEELLTVVPSIFSEKNILHVVNVILIFRLSRFLIS